LANLPTKRTEMGNSGFKATPEETYTGYSSGTGNAVTRTLTETYPDPAQLNAVWDFICRHHNGGLEEPKNDSNDHDVGDYLFQFTPTFQLGGSPMISLQDLFSGLEASFAFLNQGSEESKEVRTALSEWNRLRDFWANEAGLQEQEVDITDAIIRPFEAAFREFGDKRVFTKLYYFERNLAWRLIASLSRLVMYPKVIEQLVLRATAKSLSSFSDPLLFAFAVRNILARIAFHTEVNQAVLKVFLTVGDDDSEYRWKSDASVFDTFTILGFNRLFSPKNRVGISLSSDLDYKLVFKANNIKTKGGEALSDEQKKEFVTRLNEVQGLLKDKFDHQAGMLLEVEDFTTREILAIEEDLKTRDSEKNFLASIYHNNVRITGSTDLYSDFEEILDTYKRKNTDDFIIAKRTWTQYLGETDKGSMTVIQHLAAMKTMLVACAPTLVDIVSNDRALNEHIMNKTGTDLSNFKKNSKFNIKERWVASPKVLKMILKKGGRKAKAALDDNYRVKSAVDQLKIFRIVEDKKSEGIKSPTDVLERVAKVLSCLIDEDYVFRADEVQGEKISMMYDPNFADTCLKQIGSTLVTDEWRFSLKFCACRLNDFFDSVPLEEYLSWIGHRVRGKSIYDGTKNVAVALNKFALQMQNNIYLLAINPKKVLISGQAGAFELSPFIEMTPAKATHVQIDSLYARITRVQFMDMLARDGQQDVVNIRAQMNELITTLLNLASDFDFARENANLRRIRTELNSPKRLTIDGKDFFETLFRVSMAAATLLFVK
jgi:hypothetical protein